jgi:hypothetical protein
MLSSSTAVLYNKLPNAPNVAPIPAPPKRALLGVTNVYPNQVGVLDVSAFPIPLPIL